MEEKKNFFLSYIVIKVWIYVKFVVMLLFEKGKN